MAQGPFRMLQLAHDLLLLSLTFCILLIFGRLFRMIDDESDYRALVGDELEA